VYDYSEFPGYVPPVETGSPGIWRYRQSFGLPEYAPVISLGEGNTPLLPVRLNGQQVWLKCEYQNPSGSFKDRGAATLLSFLASRGVSTAIEDSSGNAGAAFAAYAARAGIQGKVYIPDSTSGPKRQQIESYGAEVVRILGNRSTVAEKTREVAANGEVYASHAYLPQVLPGYATVAYEIYEQLGEIPGSLIVPVGQGNLLLALWRGFESLSKVLQIPKAPLLVGVQALACAPLWALTNYGPAGLGWVAEAETVAEGVRIKTPIRGDSVLQAVEKSQGVFIAIDEERILPARDELARQGFYVEPTSSLVWEATRNLVKNLPQPVVSVLTGSGLKTEI
jgi:threonine synthase